jgi:hypothetical protein
MKIIFKKINGIKIDLYLYNFIGYDSIKQITKGKYEKTKNV